MMDETLRDNVERLLSDRKEAPSPEFAAKMDALLRPPVSVRHRPFAPLATLAAAVAIAFIVWIAGRRDVPGRDDTATVSGTVFYRGGLIPGWKVPLEFDAKCVAAHPQGLVIEPIPVDGQRRLRDCLVVVTSHFANRTFPKPTEPVIVKFDGCLLKPRNFGIRVGQELVTENVGGNFHNIHALPFRNKEFNDGVVGKEPIPRRSFDTPETGIKLKCDIHAEWENAWVTVLPHPFFAVTDAQGHFEIKGLPPGNYTLEAWQENCTPILKDFAVTPGGSVTVDLEIPSPRLGQRSGWPTNLQGPAVKAAEGKLTQVDGDLDLRASPRPASPLFQEGRTYIKLTDGDMTAYCGILKDSEQYVNGLKQWERIVLRGTCKGKLDDKSYLVEECTVVETGEPKSRR